MSEELNPNPAGEAEKNINNDTSGKQVVPVATLVEERKKYKALLSQYESRANMADEIAKISGLDDAGMRKQIELMKQKASKNPKPNNTHTPQSTSDPKLSALEEEVREMKANSALVDLKAEGLLEITPDIAEDIKGYAKDTGQSLRQALLARYGDAVLEKARTADANDKRIAGAETAFAGGTAGGGNAIPSGKLEISPLQAQGASNAGIDEAEMRVLMSNDPDAIQKFYSNLSKK